MILFALTVMGLWCVQIGAGRAPEQQQKPRLPRVRPPGRVPEAVVADLCKPLGSTCCRERRMNSWPLNRMVRHQFEARCLWRSVTPLPSRPTMRLLVMATRKTWRAR